MSYTKRGIVLVSEETGAKVEFESINAAARFAGTNFANMQKAAMTGGLVKGWRAFETPETIRRRIESLQETLEILEK